MSVDCAPNIKLAGSFSNKVLVDLPIAVLMFRLSKYWCKVWQE